ncbi:MAG: BMP family ABC transporter substrate-binding protein [Clostridia bacterium]|nr:BMP family ABC transporter substrate-binding protein [Clostridia bacterium]
MKRFLAIVLSCVMVFALAACGGTNDATVSTDADETEASLKIGVILVGDENEGYTAAHIDGINAAAEKLGIDESQIVWKYSIPEDQSCYDAAMELVDAGCTLVISNSYGHQSFTQMAAEEVPEVQFVAMTGDTAATSGLANFSNAFTKAYESRYVSGVVAGKKLAELIEAGVLTDANYDADGNVKIGYVGAYPYAEVVSGYTAFYLGVKSIVENVVMDVTYTNSWFDITAEGEAANSLVAGGCVIIGQHADSTGAPAAVQALLDAGTVCYSVGYNVDMLSVAPTAALTSATNNWEVYYEYAFSTMMNGGNIKTDWSEGYETDAVAVTALGESCAEGTAEAVEEAEAAIKAGTFHVFDTTTFTVGGETIDTYEIEGLGETISDGYFHESEFRAAPYFDLRIDGITELN